MNTATYDGRYANNAWMQELPDFMTKMTWDNAAMIAPRTASELGIAHEQIVKITLGGRELKVVAYVMPGQAQGSIALITPRKLSESTSRELAACGTTRAHVCSTATGSSARTLAKEVSRRAHRCTASSGIGFGKA